MMIKKYNVRNIGEDSNDDPTTNLVDDDDYVDDTNHAKLAREQALHLGSREKSRESSTRKETRVRGTSLEACFARQKSEENLFACLCKDYDDAIKVCCLFCSQCF